MNKFKKIADEIFNIDFQNKEKSKKLVAKILKEIDVFNDNIDFDQDNIEFFNLLNKQKVELFLEEIEKYNFNVDEILKEPFLNLKFLDEVLDDIKEEIFNKTFSDIKIVDNLIEVPTYTELLPDDFNTNLKYIFNLKEKEDFLKTEYYKAYNFIKNMKHGKVFLDMKFNNFKDYVFSIIDIRLIYNYLIGEYEIWNDSKPFERHKKLNIHNKPSILDFFDFKNVSSDLFYLFCLEYITYIESARMMIFCKNEIEKLETNMSVIENQQKETKRNSAYHSEIFKDKDAEIFVFKVLKEVGVLNKESKAIKRGFQSPCNDIWKFNMKGRDFIFKKSATIKKFILFLNNEYSANITASDKLTQSNRYTDEVNSKIKLYIKQREILLTE